MVEFIFQQIVSSFMQQLLFAQKIIRMQNFLKIRVILRHL